MQMIEDKNESWGGDIALLIFGIWLLTTLTGCTMSVTFSPLDEINNRQSWSDSEKQTNKR